MELEQVLQKFQLYSGESEPGEDAGETARKRWALCQALCGECRDWALGQVRPGAELRAEALAGLAAAEAFYQLALLDEALAPGAVTTPEVKLELRGRAEKALQLAEEKRKACAGLLQEQGFYFGRV